MGFQEKTNVGFFISINGFLNRKLENPFAGNRELYIEAIPASRSRQAVCVTHTHRNPNFAEGKG